MAADCRGAFIPGEGQGFGLWSLETCMPGPADDETELLIGLIGIENTSDDPVTLTGVDLVGTGTMSVVEAAVMPSYSDDRQKRINVGALYYPPPDKWDVDLSKWTEERETIPGAVIEPGQAVDFAYRAKASPPAYIEQSTITYRDSLGGEFIFADDPSSVVVDAYGTDCTVD